MILPPAARERGREANSWEGKKLHVNQFIDNHRIASSVFRISHPRFLTFPSLCLLYLSTRQIKKRRRSLNKRGGACSGYWGGHFFKILIRNFWLWKETLFLLFLLSKFIWRWNFSFKCRLTPAKKNTLQMDNGKKFLQNFLKTWEKITDGCEGEGGEVGRGV